jgi:hypothetical protein
MPQTLAQIQDGGRRLIYREDAKTRRRTGGCALFLFQETGTAGRREGCPAVLLVSITV